MCPIPSKALARFVLVKSSIHLYLFLQPYGEGFEVNLFVSGELKPGSLIQADDKFYLYSDVGEVALAHPSKTGFKIVSRFQIPAGRASLAFAYPVIHNGTLYVRYKNDLWLYRIK